METKSLALLALISVLPLGMAHAQTTILLENFSQVETPDTWFYGTWELNGSTLGSNSPRSTFVQGDGVYSIVGSGALADATSQIEFFLPNLTSVGTNRYISLTAARLPTNTATAVAVILRDNQVRDAIAMFDTSWFSTSLTTVVAELTVITSFDFENIESVLVSGTFLVGSPGANAVLNLQLDEIASVASASAIPEPSTYAALAGVAALGLVMYRRRKTAALTIA